MSKKTIFPSDAEISEMRDLLSKSIPSKPLAKNASTIDKIKHRLCKEFVVYKSLHQVSQKDLAAKIGIDEALMSKILHYHFDEFTIDRLIKFLNVLYPNLEFKFDLAS
jgi:predicted XRE-type DNA-binding protein